MFGNFLIFVFFFAMAFLVMMAFRNQFVYKCRMYAIDRSGEWQNKVIYETEQSDRWVEISEIRDSYPEYNEMLWDLKSWSFDALYPDIEKRMSDRFDMIKIGVPGYDHLLNEFGGLK